MAAPVAIADDKGSSQARASSDPNRRLFGTHNSKLQSAYECRKAEAFQWGDTQQARFAIERFIAMIWPRARPTSFACRERRSGISGFRLAMSDSSIGTTSASGDRPYLAAIRLAGTCILSHRDGYSDENTLSEPADNTGSKNAIQAVGSTLTYPPALHVCAGAWASHLPVMTTARRSASRSGRSGRSDRHD